MTFEPIACTLESFLLNLDQFVSSDSQPCWIPDNPTVTQLRTVPFGFETKTCSRCGGSGHYSYCQMYGTTCFQCKGRKVVYTKRAEAAIRYMWDMMTFPVESIQPGWVLFNDGVGPFAGKRGWFTVTSIQESGCKFLRDGVWIPYIDIESEAGSRGVIPGSKVEKVAPSKEYVAECKAKAYEYQASLKTNGTPYKRVPKVA